MNIYQIDTNKILIFMELYSYWVRIDPSFSSIGRETEQKFNTDFFVVFIEGSIFKSIWIPNWNVVDEADT